MNARIKRYALHLLAASVLAVTGAACDTGSDLMGPGGDESPATVEGRVEGDGSTDDSDGSSTSPSRTTPYAVASGKATTAAVAHVRGDGSLEVLAEADLDADGSFRITGVPAGRSDLVVVARGSGGSEVGRVLVHGETRSGAVITTAPINAEATVEGRVFARLKSEGVPQEERASAQLALLIHMSEATAADVAASTDAVASVAHGARAGIEAMNRTFAELSADVDARARAEAMLQAAVDHAESRHAGADADAAAEAFLSAAVDGVVRAGADAEVVSLATAAAVTSVERAAAQVDGSAGLELARNGVRLNLEARKQLAASLSSDPSKSLATGVLADLEAEVEASASLGAMIESIVDAEARFEEELTALILSELTALSATQRAEIEARLESAFATADLSARLDSAVTVSQVVQAVIEYRQELGAAVEAYLGILPDDVTATTRVSAELLMLVHGGSGLGGSDS
ncbi:MAG: hypothetical protein ACOC8K_06870 [Gemmatimonadota bacterium]